MNKPSIFFYTILCSTMFWLSLFNGIIEGNIVGMFMAGIGFSGLGFISYKIIMEQEKEFKEKESSKESNKGE